MKTLIKFFTCAFLFINISTLYANDDFGVWSSFEVNKKLKDKRFTISSGIDLRLEKQVSSIARWKGEIGLKYKMNDFLRFGASYSYLYNRYFSEQEKSYRGDIVDESRWNGYDYRRCYWRTKHRFNIDATGKLPIDRFEFSLRERYQWTRYMGVTTIKDLYRFSDLTNKTDLTKLDYNKEKNKKLKNTQFIRSRLSIEYNINHSPVDPYASVEIYNDLDKKLRLDKSRWGIGVNWKIIKHHNLKIGYLFNNGVEDLIDENIHVIDIGYEFKF